MSSHLKVFTAPWCAPCKAMKPALEELARDGLLVVEIDVDADFATAAMHRVRSVPTLKLYSEDQLIKSHCGAMTPQQLKEFTTP